MASTRLFPTSIPGARRGWQILDVAWSSALLPTLATSNGWQSRENDRRKRDALLFTAVFHVGDALPTSISELPGTSERVEAAVMVAGAVIVPQLHPAHRSRRNHRAMTPETCSSHAH